MRQRSAIFHLRRSDGASRISPCLGLYPQISCGVAILVPRYLGPLNRVADVSGRRSLRSSGTKRLVVPPDSAAELFCVPPPRSRTQCRTVHITVLSVPSEDRLAVVYIT